MRQLAPTLVALAAAVLATHAFASPITIQNASFENATGWTKQHAAPSDWSANGGTTGTGVTSVSAQATAPAGLTPADGVNVLGVYAGTGSTPSTAEGTAWLPSDQLGTYQADTVYTLTVALATESGALHQPRSSAVALSDALDGKGFADYFSTVASRTVPVADLSATTMADYSVTLDTSATPAVVGHPIGVLLEQLLGTGSQYARNMWFDNVRLDASPSNVPEPASLGLLALGGLALLRRRR